MASSPSARPRSTARCSGRCCSDALRKAGYLPRPTTPSWDDLWSTLAPCHLTVEVRERQDDTYLQSLNRLSQLESSVTLSVRGQKVWHETHNARTQIPMPGLSAYQASRLAVGSHRSPEFERLLYENARANLIDRLGATSGTCPHVEPPASTTLQEPTRHPLIRAVFVRMSHQPSATPKSSRVPV